MIDMLIETVQDPEERDVILMMKEMYEQNKEDFRRAEGGLGEVEDNRANIFSDKDLKELLEMVKASSPDSLLEFKDDQEALDEKCRDWLASQLPISLRGRKLKKSLLEERVDQLKKENPELSEYIDAQKPVIPRTLIEG